MNDVFKQLKRHALIYTVLYLAVFSLLYAFYGLAGEYGISVAYFTRDPAITLYGHPFVGVISHIGIIFWCAAMAICFFAAYVLFKAGVERLPAFLFWSGLFTGWLMLDDFFMFHEYVFPESFGIPQEAIMITYVVLMLICFLRFGRLLLSLEYTTLLLACGFFAFSVATDMWMAQSDLQFLVEDGAKLLGIVTWLMFFSRTGYAKIMSIAK